MNPTAPHSPRYQHLRFATQTSLLLIAVPFLRAQSTPATPAKAADAPVVQLEVFNVTGSNIKRMDQEKVLPVLQVDQSFISARNALTPVDLITAIPAMPNVPQNEAAAGGASIRGDIATVNLRGIGPSGSLVLLNGRRLAQNPTTAVDDTSGRTFVPNVNQVPTAGLARVDILRDGASSIYGTDAVAGVVNFITDNNFRGTKTGLRYGYPQYGGGQSIQAEFTNGIQFAGGRGSMVTSVTSLYRDAVFLRDRPYSASANHTAVAPAPFNTPGSAFDGRASVGFYPVFTIGSATANSYFYPVANGNGTPVLTNVAPTRASAPIFYQDINAMVMAQPRSERTNFLNRAQFDLINDRLTVFSELMYYQSRSRIQRQEQNVNAPNTDLRETMSADNPYNPYGSRFLSPTGAPNADGTTRVVGTPQALTFNSFPIYLHSEEIEASGVTTRFVAGLRGRLGRTWRWETGALYTHARIKDNSPSDPRESLLMQALARTDSTAFNPFWYTFQVQNGAVVPAQPYINPASVQATFAREYTRYAYSYIGSLDLQASGELGDIWSGPVSLAFGAEARKESFKTDNPPFAGVNPPGSGLDETNNDFITASPNPNSVGRRFVYSAYVEASIPLLSPRNNVPFAKQLELTASARSERYSDFGTTTKPKVGLNWKPQRGVMLRASYNQGFSAPNLPTIKQPSTFSSVGVPGITDPYRNPATLGGPYVTRVKVTGNSTLKPTASTGKSAGIVLEVPKVKGLTVTADYWQIQQDNLIGSLSNAQIINNDTLLLTAYTQKQIAAGVPIAQIDAASGTANYRGDPAIVRAAPSPADLALFAAYNAAHPRAPLAPVGLISTIARPFINFAQAYVAGWDLGANYEIPWHQFGRFSFSSDWSYYNRSYTLALPPGAAPIFTDRVPTTGRWRGNAVVTWRKGDWTTSLSGYYTGKFVDTGATTTEAIYNNLGAPRYLAKVFSGNAYNYYYVVHDVVSYNATATYRFSDRGYGYLRGVSLNLGVINLLDQNPPLTSGSAGYSSAVHASLIAGRTFTLEVKKRF